MVSARSHLQLLPDKWSSSPRQRINATSAGRPSRGSKVWSAGSAARTLSGAGVTSTRSPPARRRNRKRREQCRVRNPISRRRSRRQFAGRRGSLLSRDDRPGGGVLQFIGVVLDGWLVHRRGLPGLCQADIYLWSALALEEPDQVDERLSAWLDAAARLDTPRRVLRASGSSPAERATTEKRLALGRRGDAPPACHVDRAWSIRRSGRRGRLGRRTAGGQQRLQHLTGLRQPTSVPSRSAVPRRYTGERRCSTSATASAEPPTSPACGLGAPESTGVDLACAEAPWLDERPGRYGVLPSRTGPSSASPPRQLEHDRRDTTATASPPRSRDSSTRALRDAPRVHAHAVDGFDLERARPPDRLSMHRTIGPHRFERVLHREDDGRARDHGRRSASALSATSLRRRGPGRPQCCTELWLSRSPRPCGRRVRATGATGTFAASPGRRAGSSRTANRISERRTTGQRLLGRAKRSREEPAGAVAPRLTRRRRPTTHARAR